MPQGRCTGKVGDMAIGKKLHRDLCPIHQIPMWYTPMDGTYACQRVECGVTLPVNEHGSFKPEEDYIASLHYRPGETTLQYHVRMMTKSSLLNTPPRGWLFNGPIA